MTQATQPQSIDHWGSLHRVFQRLDHPFRLAANLTLLSIVGAIVGSYVQYNSWRHEKNLTRYREELSNAVANFSEISGALSAAMNLQESLYYTYKNALGHYGAVDNDKKIFLRRNAQKIYGDYYTARTALRNNIDVLAGKAELFIDRPLQPDNQRINASSEEPLLASDRDSLRNRKFDCERDMPVSVRSSAPVAPAAIDWRRTKDHVTTLYYCLEEIHSALFPVRVWAEAGSPKQENVESPNDNAGLATEKMKKIENRLTLQIRRLNAFISLSTSNIEIIRLRDRPKPFLYHQLGIDH
jgi:hypothetical protein